MKVLHESKYKWIGTNGYNHVFISTQECFDPEILHLFRAKLKRRDGSFKYFDPIKEVNERPKVKVMWEGFTQDMKEFHIEIELDDNFNSAVCVSESIRCRA